MIKKTLAVLLIGIALLGTAACDEEYEKNHWCETWRGAQC